MIVYAAELEWKTRADSCVHKSCLHLPSPQRCSTLEGEIIQAVVLLERPKITDRILVLSVQVVQKIVVKVLLEWLVKQL